MHQGKSLHFNLTLFASQLKMYISHCKSKNYVKDNSVLTTSVSFNKVIIPMVRWSLDGIWNKLGSTPWHCKSKL